MKAALARWEDFENVASKVAILPMGSFEQHGPHMPVTTDVIQAEYVSSEVEKRLKNGVVVFPPVIYACSQEHSGYTGTIMVGYDTFINYVRPIVEGIHKMGFRDTMIINGHGGNIDALHVLQRAVNLSNTGIRLHLFNTLNFELTKKVFEGREPNHADYVESSKIAAINKKLVDVSKLSKLKENDFKLKDKDVFTLATTKEATNAGIVETGGAFYSVDVKKGRVLLDMLIDQAVNKVRDLIRQQKSKKM